MLSVFSPGLKRTIAFRQVNSIGSILNILNRLNISFICCISAQSRAAGGPGISPAEIKSPGSWSRSASGEKGTSHCTKLRRNSSRQQSLNNATWKKTIKQGNYSFNSKRIVNYVQTNKKYQKLFNFIIHFIYKSKIKQVNQNCIYKLYAIIVLVNERVS